LKSEHFSNLEKIESNETEETVETSEPQEPTETHLTQKKKLVTLRPCLLLEVLLWLVEIILWRIG
jgi:hypothetical protein